MPEVFRNFYTFPDRASVPSPAQVRDALSDALRTTFQMQSHPAGFHGAPREYAELTSPEVRAWAFWEPGRPQVEVQIDEPMDRMLAVNAALRSLGGAPADDDASWQRRARQRVRSAITGVVWKAIALTIFVGVIWLWGWWGLLGGVAVVVGLCVIYTIALARAFAKG